MLTIIYSEEGIPLGDHEFISTAERLVKEAADKDVVYETSSEGLLYAMRLMVIRGHLPCDSLRIDHKGKVCNVNKYGAFVEYPVDLCSPIAAMSFEIIRGAIGIKDREWRPRYPRKSTRFEVIVEDLDGPWEKEETAICGNCAARFTVDTETLSLEDGEPAVQCPECMTEGSLVPILPPEPFRTYHGELLRDHYES